MPYLNVGRIVFPPPEGYAYVVTAQGDNNGVWQGAFVLPHNPAYDNRPRVFMADLESVDYWCSTTMAGKILPPPPDGFLHWRDHNERLHTLPELPDGESYHTVYSGNGGCVVVPSWFTHSAYLFSTPYGPDVFGCPYRCLWRDGCASCNSATWRTCSGGGCSDNYYRVSVSLPRNQCLCGITCSDCDDSLLPLHADSTVYGTRICRSCRVVNYSYCDHCGSNVRDNDYSHEDECRSDCDDTCCVDPPDEDEDEDNGADGCINSYSYKPSPRFHGTAGYYLGLECEVSTADSSHDRLTIAESVNESLGNLGYLKSDCSITRGFEIVTHPMSYAYALESFPWGMFATLRDRYGMRNSSECGIHVHVSRTAFSGPSHTYRWLKFFYRNSEPLQQLARRTGSSYSQFGGTGAQWAIHDAAQIRRSRRYDPYAADPWYLKTPGGQQRLRRYGSPGTNRYSAVNVENEATFEVRIFASSLYQSQVKAALGLVHATVEYTRTLTANAIIKRDALGFDAFRAWTKDNNTDGQYDSLLSEIERLVH